MRRRRPEKREILPDPVFNDLVVTKFVNNLMTSGKKSISEKIFYKSLEIAKSQSKENDGWKILSLPSPPPTIGGKGCLVHEYASHVGAKLVFSHYQAAWNKFNK